MKFKDDLVGVDPLPPRDARNARKMQERCLLQETTFKSPMYVPVIQNRISQINIAIYDGDGELVPFVSGAVTSLRLHFRRL